MLHAVNLLGDLLTEIMLHVQGLGPGGADGPSQQLGAVRKLDMPPAAAAAPAQQSASSLWGVLGSVVSAGRSQPDATAARRPPSRRLRFATTRDGSALRLHALSASTLDCWQVCAPDAMYKQCV